MKFFIGNWKMFGVPRSINILNKINKFIKKDSNRNKYKVIVAHVDHAIREDSLKDKMFVESLCRELKIHFFYWMKLIK